MQYGIKTASVSSRSNKENPASRELQEVVVLKGGEIGNRVLTED